MDKTQQMTAHWEKFSLSSFEDKKASVTALLEEATKISEVSADILEYVAKSPEVTEDELIEIYRSIMRAVFIEEDFRDKRDMEAFASIRQKAQEFAKKEREEALAATREAEELVTNF